MKKGEGLWESKKEILGRMFEGNEYTMQLPRAKCGKILLDWPIPSQVLQLVQLY
jgi:hypothetical protein